MACLAAPGPRRSDGPAAVVQASGQQAAPLLDQALAHGVVARQRVAATFTPGILPGQRGNSRLQLCAGRQHKRDASRCKKRPSCAGRVHGGLMVVGDRAVCQLTRIARTSPP
jgi:hypothetical protein